MRQRARLERRTRTFADFDELLAASDLTLSPGKRRRVTVHEAGMRGAHPTRSRRAPSTLLRELHGISRASRLAEQHLGLPGRAKFARGCHQSRIVAWAPQSRQTHKPQQSLLLRRSVELNLRTDR